MPAFSLINASLCDSNPVLSKVAILLTSELEPSFSDDLLDKIPFHPGGAVEEELISFRISGLLTMGHRTATKPSTSAYSLFLKVKFPSCHRAFRGGDVVTENRSCGVVSPPLL